MRFYDRLLTKIAELYPQTAAAVPLREKLSDKLICPAVVRLPRAVEIQARAIVAAFFELRNLAAYQATVAGPIPAPKAPNNLSALMSFDFHLDDNGVLRLIEINTNASMGAVMDAVYKTHGLDNPFSSDFSREIIATFEEEFRRSGISRPLERVAILDEKPEDQRLFVEFLLYQELFRRHGLECEIADPVDLRPDAAQGLLEGRNGPLDLIYNRHTDFYFAEPPHRHLLEAFLAGHACFSPNPWEYQLLADKERLRELSVADRLDALPLSANAREAIRATLLPTLDANAVDPDELWSRRKALFFKPKRMFGGKAAYKGSSISRVMFEQVLKGDYIAQEFCPPPTLSVAGEDGVERVFKYDLRFFTYADRVQLGCARLYQGQTTNFQAEGGGVAALSFA